MRARILVTRPEPQAAALAALLDERGLEPISVPTIAVDRASAWPVLDAMLASLEGAAWLVVTSANGADAILERLDATGRRLPPGTRIAAVGPQSAAPFAEAGIRVDHVPDEHLSGAIAEGLGDVAGRRVVLARGDIATSELRDALLARRAVVEEVVAYRVLEGPADSRESLHAAIHDGLSGLAFASASAVRGLLRLASPVDESRVRAVRAFCIGPPTAAAARGSGFDVAAVADPHTAIGLADAIANSFTREIS